MNLQSVRRRIEFGDFLLLFYALVFIRQYAWMVPNDPAAWAASLTLTGMEERFRETEIWLAETDVVAGWIAIRADSIAGLYTDPRAPLSVQKFCSARQSFLHFHKRQRRHLI